ncbi:hypothetical protein ACEPAH_8931 [Sanghuangporus vaninii]
MSLIILNVRLAHTDQDLTTKLYTIHCNGKNVLKMEPQEKFTWNDEWEHDSIYVNGRGGLLVPSLCHSHIHTDKCFILDKGAPLVVGDFSEALRVTSAVKETFIRDTDDLYKRGERLVRESIESGVTCMRAHVEVDKTVQDAGLKTGIKLKEYFREACDIQLTLFMQDPIFDNDTDDTPGSNAFLASQAAERYTSSLGAIGSAPYVERTRKQQRANIRFVLDLAVKYNLHADFHIDYDLSPLPADPNSDTAPLIYYLLDVLHEIRWTERMPGRTIVLGHATRLTLFSPAQLSDLRERISSLPVYFVGLPQSDVYMMGRASEQQRRGTLNVCKLGREYDLRVAMSVNNVGNAFTPQGTPDPMGLCPLGVAVYQDGTLDGCGRLLEAVSISSKRAVGLPESDYETASDSDNTATSLISTVGSPADFVILHENQSLQSAVLEPCFPRTTIKDGCVIAKRDVKRELYIS